jgi:UDP-glucuronate 4-epimerase
MGAVNVLVTGGAGFIGSHVCEALLARGDRVIALDNFDPWYDPALKWANLDACLADQRFGLVEGDVRDAEAVAQLFVRGGFDAVVHLAGFAGVRASLDDPLACESVNVGGTLVLLEAARRAGRPRFVLASTSSVYGLSPAIPYREDDPLLSPVSPYGASKIAAEKYAHIYHAVHGLPVASLRFFTAYGPRQRPDMAFRRFAAILLAGRPVPLYGDGGTTRDYTFISDVTAGVLAALDSAVHYGVFNIGNDRAHRLDEAVRLLAAALGVEARLEHLPEQPGDPPHTRADISAARAALGYAPRVGLADGLARFAEWLRACG